MSSPLIIDWKRPALAVLENTPGYFGSMARFQVKTATHLVEKE
jgi:hypothetical protein